MNYTARYSLEFNPFIKNSKEILIETSQYKEVRFRLDYLLQTKGFGLIHSFNTRLQVPSLHQCQGHSIL